MTLDEAIGLSQSLAAPARALAPVHPVLPVADQQRELRGVHRLARRSGVVAVALTRPRGLLLDLDGVVVLEARAPDGEQEILRLHPDLPGRLGALGLPVIVL